MISHLQLPRFRSDHALVDNLRTCKQFRLFVPPFWNGGHDLTPPVRRGDLVRDQSLFSSGRFEQRDY
jgi:hypothetical protein